MIRGLLIFAAFLSAAPAHADRALLIGVGAYPDLPPALRLEAPEEDARRVAAALEAAGFARDHVTLMTATDGTPPTRAAVLAALDALARDAVRGEAVLVYFSGHGAQAPTATPALEPDGLDELYLMLDARGWDGGRGLVPGAILDKELVAKIAAIRARGADVWFVADACHAGGAFRGGEPGVRVKAVTPDALGIPDRVAPHPPAVAAVVERPDWGRLAAFYAAGPSGLAIERRLPFGSPDARPLSQFSFALVRAIAAGRLRSLRDLAVAVAAADVGLGGGAPDPVFEGALDRSVLGLAADRPRRYAVGREGAALTIPAGLEEGFAPGDHVRLIAGGAAVGEGVLATVALGVSSLTAGALPPGAVEAERALGAVDDSTRHAALLAAIAPLTARGAAEGLAVSGAVWRPGARRDCPVLPGGAGPSAQAVSLLGGLTLGQCDVLLATIANRGATTVDVSPIYFDAAGNVTGLGFVDGGGVRLPPGGARRVAIRALVEDRAGRPMAQGIERLAIVALPATTLAPRDLRGAASATMRSGGAIALDAGAGALTYRWRVAGR